MDSQILADMVEFVLDSREDYRPHQVIVVRHGRTVLDIAFYPFPLGVRHDVASVGKMITATLIGIAIDQGFIASADEPVLSFFPDRVIANRDARKEAMTIAHLLAQRSGIYHGDDGSHGEEDAAMMASPDWVQWILDRPMDSEPGGIYYYSNANYHLAAGVLAQAAGMTPLEFARRYLFAPLRIPDVIWRADPQGINHGHGGQLLMPMDMAKLGVLYMSGGDWRGRQVVSPEWVQLSTTGYPGPPPPGWPPEWSMGFHWAINSQLDFAETAGSGGQVIRFLPENDLVIVSVAGGGPAYDGCGRNGALINDWLYDHVSNSILSSSPIDPNPQGVAGLASLVEEASLAADGPPEPVPPLPAIASTISGARFVMDSNPPLLEWFSLSFPGGDEATLEYQGPERVAIRIGLDDVFRVSPGEFGLPFAAKGWWADGSRFRMLFDQVPFYRYFDVEFLFDNDDVTITLEDMACGDPPLTMTGRR
jgi:CubicO group peptidase (beta-lactamase class C family)